MRSSFSTLEMKWKFCENFLTSGIFQYSQAYLSCLAKEWIVVKNVFCLSPCSIKDNNIITFPWRKLFERLNIFSCERKILYNEKGHSWGLPFKQ